uniref:Reverse transcriptase zinc-binding domain-containing protein n=1 Tax=Tanacetum cinerariifolium TaxID=118510 RepID=A0A699JRW5_TANCI|nr:reverse transcriptase zinc-binding domain-containing protein [Tanacetum cinerariifolium]
MANIQNMYDLENCIGYLTVLPCKNSIWSVVRRLCFADTMYHIWQERNTKIFHKKERSSKSLTINILDSVKSRLLTLKVKNSNAVEKMDGVVDLMGMALLPMEHYQVDNKGLFGIRKYGKILSGLITFDYQTNKFWSEFLVRAATKYEGYAGYGLDIKSSRLLETSRGPYNLTTRTYLLVLILLVNVEVIRAYLLKGMVLFGKGRVFVDGNVARKPGFSMVADIFSEVKTASTSMETSKPLLKDEDGQEVDVYMYISMIGSLMYLTSSRPDIMFDTVVANSTTEAEYVAASSCCGQMDVESNKRSDDVIEGRSKNEGLGLRVKGASIESKMFTSQL